MDYHNERNLEMMQFVKTVYNSMRIQTWYLISANPYIKKKDKPKSPEKLLKFNWEKKGQSVEEMKQTLFQIRDIYKERNKK